MEIPENIITTKKSKWVHIIITQAICVLVILSVVLVTKFFFKNTYKEIKEWYGINILNDTDINEILRDGDANEV